MFGISKGQVPTLGALEEGREEARRARDTRPSQRTMTGWMRYCDMVGRSSAEQAFPILGISGPMAGGNSLAGTPFEIAPWPINGFFPKTLLPPFGIMDMFWRETRQSK